MRSRVTQSEVPPEEPGRWLYFTGRDGLAMIHARIRGLHTVEEVQEWVQWEAENERRKDVIAHLNQRKSTLEERGWITPEDLPF